MNLSGMALGRRIGLWILMMSAGLVAYGVGLYQGSAFRMGRMMASEGYPVPVIIEGSVTPDMKSSHASLAKSSADKSPAENRGREKGQDSNQGGPVKTHSKAIRHVKASASRGLSKPSSTLNIQNNTQTLTSPTGQH